MPGALYYIVCRGNGKNPVFKTQADRKGFLDYLGKCARLFGFQVHSYCLMKNEVHLLIESSRANLSEFMRRLLTGYTAFYHRRHNTDGSLFSGRFKSFVVDKKNYLAEISREVHRAPVEAGLVKRPEDYNWSSMKGFLKAKDAPDFLVRGDVLKTVGNRPANYKKFVHQKPDEKEMPDKIQQKYLGDKAFARRMEKRLAKKVEKKAAGKTKGAKSRVKAKKDDKFAQNVLQAVADEIGISTKDLVRTGQRRSYLNLGRKKAVYLIRENSELTYRQIAEMLNLSIPYVQRLYREAVSSKKFRDDAQKLLKKIAT